jgi:hypothetical protein
VWPRLSTGCNSAAPQILHFVIGIVQDSLW